MEVILMQINGPGILQFSQRCKSNFTKPLKKAFLSLSGSILLGFGHGKLENVFSTGTPARRLKIKI